MSDKFDYEESTGNVFQDLGFVDAEEKLAKAKLASRIIEILKKKGLNQTKAGTILGIDQPKISALYRGRLSDFSISRLLKFLMLLEQDVEIKIKDKSVSQDHFGHLIVCHNKLK